VVTNSNPLAELNDLLRLNGRVVRVEDRFERRKSRPTGVGRWRLDVESPPTDRMPQGQVLKAVVQDSALMRRPGELNGWAQWWGRDPGLPLLTAEDGRRALRLMHEAFEAWEAVNNRNNTGTDINTKEVAG